MTDDLTAEQLEQLARSLTMSGALGDADRLTVVEVLRDVAARRRREAG